MSVSQMHLEVFRLINDGGKLYPSLNPFVVFIAEYMVYVLGMATIAYWFTRPKKNRMMVIHALMAFTHGPSSRNSLRKMNKCRNKAGCD